MPEGQKFLLSAGKFHKSPIFPTARILMPGTAQAYEMISCRHRITVLPARGDPEYLPGIHQHPYIKVLQNRLIHLK